MSRRRILAAALLCLAVGATLAEAQELFQAQADSGFVSVASRAPGQEVYLNGEYAGVTPLVGVRVPVGPIRILVRSTRIYSWMQSDWQSEGIVTANDTLRVVAKPARAYSLRSRPYGADVYNGDQHMGRTPLVFSLPDSAARSLRLRKDGYRTESVSIVPDGPQFFDLILTRDGSFRVQQDRLAEEMVRLKDKRRRNALLLTGLSVLSGASAVLLKNRADQRFEQYQRTADPVAREELFADTERYDTYASAAFAAFQVSFGLGFYYFLRSR